MKKQVRQIITYSAFITIGLYLLILGLYQAKTFLVPLAIAVLLSMVMLPVSKKLEKWGIPKGLSVLISDLIILIFFSGLGLVVGMQVNDIAQKWPEYKQKMMPKLEKADKFIQEKTGFSISKQLEKQKENRQQIASKAGKAFTNVFAFLGNSFLVFIYIFFFMYYRKKFFNSVLKFFPGNKRDTVAETLRNFADVVQQYLFGRFILMSILIVFYIIGFSIIGIDHAIMISIIAGVLDIIPYIGNLIAFALTLFLSFLVKGGVEIFIGVIIVFGISQFIENYLLQPFLVGKKVNLNPVVTIVGVVAGGAIWGVAGLILAIPLMGIFKVLFDSISVLNPMGYLIGEEDMGSENGFINKVKNKILKIFKKQDDE